MVPDVATGLKSDPVFQRGLGLFQRGEYFECHEVWEDLWRASGPPRRLFLQALIHLAVSAYHREGGNPVGAGRQMAKALKKLAGYLPAYEGLDTWTAYREAAAGRSRVTLSWLS
jgi:uncharacterized protein